MMSESDREDPDKLADELEHEAAQLQEQSEKLHGDVAEVREDWERKRRDQNVPGAPEPTDSSEGGETRDTSPAPESPPEEEGPSKAEMPPEGAIGPPKDQLEGGS
jgi:hypothetical protein